MRTARKMVTVMGGGQTLWTIDTAPVPTLSVTELLANPTFSAWTGDNPNSWTVNGEPANGEVSEVGPGEAHGGAGTGRANLYATGNYLELYQNVLTVGKLYCAVVTVDTVTAGAFNSYMGTYPSTVKTISGIGATTFCGQAGATRFNNNSGSCDVTFTSMSVKGFTNQFSGVQAAKAEHTVKADITAASGQIGGVWCAGDSATSPTNYVIATIDQLYGGGTRVRVFKFAPTATLLGATAVTYGAGRTLQLARSGADVNVSYNGSVIATYTLTDAVLLSGKCAGVVSTSATEVSFANAEVTI